MHIGHYQLGDFVPLRCWVRTSSHAPTLPADVPVATIRSSTATLETRSLPIRDKADNTSYFSYKLNLDARYSTGLYTVSYDYTVGGTITGSLDVFEIVAGGSYDGAGIAMEFFETPVGSYVLLQTDLGQIKRLKNPKVS